MIALALVGLFVVQDPAPKPAEQGGPPKAEQAEAAPKLEQWDDRTARKKVKEFEKAVKPKKASMRDRKQALDELAKGQSRALIKPLAKFIEKDTSVVLRKQAVEVLGRQPAEQAHKAILRLLDDAEVAANPQVQAGLIHALAVAGYTGDDWDEIDEVLEEDYDTERVPVHEAILDLVTKHKEVQAIPMLLRNLDPPSPDNVDSADNPPEAYWKARWHSWAVWKGKVKDALFAITGQRFSTRKEAELWLSKNGDKLK